MITEEQKIKIQNVILKTKVLTDGAGYLPEIKFVETLEEAKLLAESVHVNIRMPNYVHSQGDRFNNKDFVDSFGQSSRPLDAAKTLDRICKCGLGTVRVHIGMKGKIGGRTNAIKLYIS